MDVIKAIKTRRSIRSFKKKAVPISDIKKNNLSKKTGTKELNNPNISKEINELETLVDE